MGKAARDVYADGQAMLQRIIDERWLTANGVIALLPAAWLATFGSLVFRARLRIGEWPSAGHKDPLEIWLSSILSG